MIAIFYLRSSIISRRLSISLLPPGIYSRAAFFVERKNFIRLRLRSFHAGRTNGHSRHGKPDNRRCLFEHPLDQIGGNMAFDNVTIDHRGMAGMKSARHSVFDFHVGELLAENVFLLHLETVGLQVTHPLRAAASRRIRIDDYGWRARYRLRIDESKSRQHQE
jgi:hypothetical protein